MYQEDEWLTALAEGDERAIWRKHWFPHNYEITAFEAYFDMWVLTGNATYIRAVKGGWKMLRESFIHIGGSIALNEGSHGTNLSEGLWYPPKSYYLEGAPTATFQNATTLGHKTGETCGSVFWIKLNQRFHHHFPSDEGYVAEIERSLLNIGIANQAPTVGDPLAGIRSFALLHGHKNYRQHISTCCEGQGTRLHGSLPEYLFSLIYAAAGAGEVDAAAAAAAGGGAAAVAGVSVDIYAPASIAFNVTSGRGALGQVTLTVSSSFPYANANGALPVAVRISIAPPSLAFQLALRIPGWVATPKLPILLNGDALSEAARGSYATFNRTWHNGDVLSLDLPMALRATEYIGVNQVNGTRRWAYEFGPTLLAARPTTPSAWDATIDCLRVRGVDASEPAAWLMRGGSEDEPMRFVPSAAAAQNDVDFIPYFAVADERMTVYPCYEERPSNTEVASTHRTASNWTGPELQLHRTSPGGFPALQLMGTRPFPPFWMNVNNQGREANLSAVEVQIVRARRAGLRLLSVVLSDGLDVPPVNQATQQIFDLVAQHHPNASLILRWYVKGCPAWRMIAQSTVSPNTTAGTSFSSPTNLWAASAAANLSVALSHLDSAYPGRIAGVQIEGLHTGEWFVAAADAAGTMIPDYTPEMEAEFCATEAGGGRCTLPSAEARSRATLGDRLLQWQRATQPSARSFRYHRFLSEQAAAAISALAAAVKRATCGRTLTLAFYGYLFALSDTRLTGSAHLSLSTLLRSPDLDIVASPYQYPAAVRRPSGRLTAHGPVDSATLHKKVWAVEDDSRTVLSNPGEFDRHVSDLAGTVRLLRRNLYTAMLQRAAIYWLDLKSYGWFGRADNSSMLTATDAIWSNASHVLSQWRALLTSATLQAELLPAPQVAIFVDEMSAAARPLYGKGGTSRSNAIAFERALLQYPWQDLMGIGTAVVAHTLSDLLHPSFDPSILKLAVLPNAFMIAPELRAAIQTKLQHGGRTVAWVYAPGIFGGGCRDGPCTPDLQAASQLVGMPLRMNSTVAVPLETTFAPAPGLLPPSLAGSSYGADLGEVAPWLSCDGADRATVLGHYGAAAGRKPSACMSHEASHTSVFIGAPRPPLALWRALALNAGVHLYTSESESADNGLAVRADAVTYGASALLYHAGASAGGAVQAGRRRQVTLPQKLAVKSEWGEDVCTSAQPCDSFSTPALQDGESVLYWLSSDR